MPESGTLTDPRFQFSQTGHGEAGIVTRMKRLTPILIVDSIPACLGFWIDTLGFEQTMEVPHGDEPGFVMLQQGSVELMLQSRASVAADIASLAEEDFHSVLYLELEDLEPARKACATCPVVYEERKTFYGALEIGLRDPVGNVVICAYFEQDPRAAN